jgi:hypothetical protein
MQELLCAGSATADEEPSLPTPPATTAETRAPRPAPRSQQVADQQPPQPRRQNNTHRIPSTVDPRDMVQFDATDDELQISSEDDGNDQEYVQSDGDDDLLQVGRSQPVGGRSTRHRQASAPAPPRRGSRPSRFTRQHRAPSARATRARNEIDERGDLDEDEYESDEPMDAAGEQSEVCFDLWISAQHHCIALQAAEHHFASPSCKFWFLQAHSGVQNAVDLLIRWSACRIPRVRPSCQILRKRQKEDAQAGDRVPARALSAPEGPHLAATAAVALDRQPAAAVVLVQPTHAH